MRDTSLESMVVRVPWGDNMTDDQLLELSSLNPDLRIELTAEGELIFMPPAGGETGDRNAEVAMQLRQWAKRAGTGKSFDSSTGFRLPNGAVRSPDAAWVSNEVWLSLTDEQRQKYPPIAPEFVIGLLSPTDSVQVAQRKMEEYIENGTQLGWLIDPPNRRLYIFTPEGVSESDEPAAVDGGPLLMGFRLDLQEVW